MAYFSIADLPDQIHDAKARIADETAQLKVAEEAVETRFDVAVAHDGKGRAVTGLAQHDVDDVVDAGVALPCDEKVLRRIFDDFSPITVARDAFQEILNCFEPKVGNEHDNVNRAKLFG